MKSKVKSKGVKSRGAKSNVTLRMDADLLKEAKVLAAREGSSVSRLLSEHLEELVRRDRLYEGSRQRALDRLEAGLDLGWSPAASREELHER